MSPQQVTCFLKSGNQKICFSQTFSHIFKCFEITDLNTLIEMKMKASVKSGIEVSNNSVTIVMHEKKTKGR